MEISSWPSNLLSEQAVRSWIATNLPEVVSVEGPTKIEQVKSWGVAARFRVQFQTTAEQDVIFKASHSPIYTYGPDVDQLLMRYCPDQVPELLAWQAWPDKAWMLYRPFAAPHVSAQLSIEALCQIAMTMAQIQIRITEAPLSAFTALPRTAVTTLPTEFTVVMQDIMDRQWQIWQDDEPWLLTEFHVPDDLMPRLWAFTRQITDWADELAAMHWPDTIEHADLQADNAALADDGAMLIFDWEEGSIGCPFFSLFRLLFDARQLDIEQGRSPAVYDGNYSPGELAIRQVYIETLPWRTLAERARAFDLAMCLAPFRTIHNGMLFAAAQGRIKGNPRECAMLSSWAVQRWEAFGHGSKT